MPTPANALDITSSGYVKFDGTNSFSGVTKVPIADGGTNANSFGTSNGIVTYNGTSLVTTAGSTMASGVWSNTNQPFLYAQQLTPQSNCTGDGTTVVVICDNIVTQQGGSNYNNATGVYTIPSTGVYLITCSVGFTGITTDMTAANIAICQGTDGNNNYLQKQFNPANYMSSANEFTESCDIILYLTASTTISIQATISFGAKVASTKQYYGAKAWGYTTFTLAKLF